MTTYHVYLMPFTRAGKTCYYTGYTSDQRLKTREHEHRTSKRDRRYHWCGELRVIDPFPGWPLDTVSLAMRAEAWVKARTSKWKARYYKEGRGAGHP